MAFCIECGAKVPDHAKFCHQCGAALVIPETNIEAAPVVAEVESNPTIPEDIRTDDNGDVEEQELTPPAEDVDAPPSVAESLKASAESVAEDPKSKTGLLIGFSAIALLAAAGGAYALGLFGKTSTESTPSASVETSKTPEIDDTIPSLEINSSGEKTILSDYTAAIKSGRISDLGKFAAENPKSSLAKDAETAAFTSLERQGSVLAFTTFTKFFPDADVTSYTGLRTNADVANPTSETNEDTPAVIQTDNDIAAEPVSQTFNIPDIRPSLTSRAEALDPFIAQGDTSYALSVLDEMLALSDLNEAEATYLLNRKASAETAQGITPVVISTPDEPTSIESTAVTETPTPSALETSSEPVGEAPLTKPVPDVKMEILAFDTPAKPIERFGAITPDEATKPGECDMTFSINVSGSPINIVPSCTDPLFIAPAKETVAEWIYSPALLAGAPVQQDGIVVKIKFHLEDTE